MQKSEVLRLGLPNFQQNVLGLTHRLYAMDRFTQLSWLILLGEQRIKHQIRIALGLGAF